jgi:hypothetical protein
MKQSSYSIGAAQGKLRAIAGDHFITLPIKVKKSDVLAALDSNEILKAGTLLTVEGKTVTTVTGTPTTTNAYGVVYEDVSFKNSQSPDATPGNATEVVSVFVHGVLYESEVKFSADTIVGGKSAEKAALKQILFV